MDKIVITAAEAAKALATSPNTVKELLETGQLPAYRDGRNWSIPISLLHEYVESRARAESQERRKQCQE